MRLALLDFQNEYLDKFIKQIRNALAESNSDLQSVSLSAPTGSGKTVIATAAIERLFYGDDDNPGDPEAVVLWITDQPELNRQTRNRMLSMSDLLRKDRLVEIEEGTFDQAELDPGHIYFLNTQKLGVKSKLVREGDEQTYTLWQTFTNTLAAQGRHFYVFIDEAHRGMSEGRDRKEATTIIQKFIKGSNGDLPPVPLIVGLSATLERFEELLEGTNRVRRSISVPADVVRDSGLIKEKIVLHYPSSTSESEMTLLGVAAEQLKVYQQQWNDYARSQGIAPVNPLLVVQVEDGSGKTVSSTDLDEALKRCEAVLGALGDDEVGHAFETHGAIEFGSRKIRYVAPSDIDGETSLRVVFFKKSLSVGWDCPRAEAMMSFRAARDATLIAQLIGRIVRTPLARRIGTNEHLNTVAVCLPRYDKQHVDKIVAYLTNPQNAALEGDDIVDAGELATLHRADQSDRLFEELEELPSFSVPTTRTVRNTERLRRLAQQLSNDDIDANAPDEAMGKLIALLDEELETKSSDDSFKSLVSQSGSVSVEAYAWTFGESEAVATGNTTVTLDTLDLLKVFNSVGRRLGDVYKPWWRHRVETAGIDPDEARREIIAMAGDVGLQARLEAFSGQEVDVLLANHRKAISAQLDEAKQIYERIRGTSDQPTIEPLWFPDTIDIRRDKEAAPLAKHIYVDDAASFPGHLNNWERKIILEELDRSDVIGWFRNEPRKPGRSLCVPYKMGATIKPMYPDFIVLRLESGEVVADLLDPHTTSLVDAPAKAVGLAEFARDHGSSFGRIALLIVDSGSRAIVRLDLQKTSVRNEVLKVKTSEHLEALYTLSAG